MFNVGIIGAESFDDYNFCQEKCIKCLKKKADSGESITIFPLATVLLINLVNVFILTLKISIQIGKRMEKWR